MEILGFVGMIISVLVFIFLVCKGFNLFFSTIISSLIICLTSWLNGYTMIIGKFMTTTSGFLNKYLLLFILSALFGKVMDDTGANRKIALSLAKLTQKSKKNQAFWTVMILPVFYFILSYVGISGFVVVFTVVAVGRELFEKNDISWAMYCYGSAGIFPAILLGGSLQAANVVATGIFRESTKAGFALSIVLTIVSWIVLGIMIKFDVKKLQKKGEGFLPTGEAIKKLQLAEPTPEENLPNLIVSIIPLIIAIGAILFGLTPELSLLISIIVTFALMFKHLKSAKATLGNGITAAIVPVISVAAASGYAAIIAASAGYVVIGKWLNMLPSFLPAVFVVAIMSAFVASSSSSMPVFGEFIAKNFASAGIGTGVAARLTATAGFTYMMPHSPGIVNAVQLTKLDYKRAGWIYFKSTALPGLVALIVGILLVMTRLFV